MAVTATERRKRTDSLQFPIIPLKYSLLTRRSPFVVLLVNMLVNRLVVQQAMRVVKSDFLDHNENGQFEEHPMKSGQFSDRCESSSLHSIIGHHGHRYADQELIDQNCCDNLEETLFVHRFIRSRLDFVLSQERWFVCHVHKGEQATHSPVEYKD